MARSIPIGRGSIGEAQLPERLPASGAAEAGMAVADGASRAGQEMQRGIGEIGRAFEVGAAIERDNAEKIRNAQTRGQLKGAGVLFDRIGLGIEKELLEAGDDVFRNDESLSDFKAQVLERVDQQWMQYLDKNPLSDDAALVVDNEFPAIRAGFELAIDKGAIERTRRVLRADADADGDERMNMVTSFDDVETQTDYLRSNVFTDDLFTDVEINEKVTLLRERGYANVLSQAYDRDVAEGALLAFSLPGGVIRNKDGTVSTEKTITVSVGPAVPIIGGAIELPGGEFVNIPTIVGGVEVSEEKAIEAWKQGRNPATGRFATKEEAVAAAKARSAGGGSTRGLTEKFRMQERRTARQQLESEYDPVNGVYGFETMVKDSEITKEEAKFIGDNPHRLGEIFEAKVSVLRGKHLAFKEDRATIEQILGKEAAAEIDKNFAIAGDGIEETLATLELAADILRGKKEGVGPHDPRTNRAAELMASTGGRLERLRGIEDDEEYARQFTQDIDRLNTFTKSWAGAIVSGWDVDNPASKARAAITFGMLHDRGDSFLNGPGKDTIQSKAAVQMLMVDNMIRRLKVGKAQAVESVLERTREVDIVKLAQDFEKTYTAESQREAIEALSDRWFSIDPTAPEFEGGRMVGPEIIGMGFEDLTPPPQMVADFTELTLLYYQQTGGDIEVSRKYAWAQLQASWGLTYDGKVHSENSRRRWAYMPPELAFQGSGDTAWMGEQFRVDYAKNVGGELRAFDLRFIPVHDPDDPEGRPAYIAIEIGDEGFPRLVERKDGELFIWKPNYAESDKAKKIMLEDEKAAKGIILGKEKRTIEIMRISLHQAMGSLAGSDKPEDVRMVDRLRRTTEALNEFEADAMTAGKRDVSPEEFEKLLEGFNSKLPLTDDEMKSMGIEIPKWENTEQMQRSRNKHRVIRRR